MALWREGISRRVHKDSKRTFRWINRRSANVSSIEIEKDPTDVTVVDSISGDLIDLTMTGFSAAGQTYKIGPKITFTDGSIDLFPVEFETWE